MLLVSRPLLGAATGPTDGKGEREIAALEQSVETSIQAGRYDRAAALLRGLETLRAPSPEPIYRQAEVFALAGQYDQAIETYRRYAASDGNDATRKTRALSEATRLAEAPVPFVETAFRATRAPDVARTLFGAGKAAATAKQDELAARLLEASLRLDPELPGPYRLLGAVYGRLGDKPREVKFLAAYLRLRPEGPIAEEVRKRLVNEKVLGDLDIDASFPCEVRVDGRSMGRQTPVKKLRLPAGRYTITLVNDRFHIVRNLHVEMVAGKSVAKSFSFGVLRTKLDPWARVRVDGKDIGLWDEIGIPEGKHKVSYRAHDNSQEKTIDVALSGGKHEALSW